MQVVVVFHLDHFFVHPHVDVTLKVLRQPFTIQTHFGRNGTSPISRSDDADLVELLGGGLGIDCCCCRRSIHGIGT